jgi:hypothetical protein
MAFIGIYVPALTLVVIPDSASDFTGTMMVLSDLLSWLVRQQINVAVANAGL